MTSAAAARWVGVVPWWRHAKAGHGICDDVTSLSDCHAS